jgi:transposase-like protein
MERRLHGYDIVAIIIDGKTFKDDEMMIALGVTIEGRKVTLGFIQTGTENASVCRNFLISLLERGLRIKEGVLCVMDGSKGIKKAVEEIFGRYAVIQRCQWHKRENVVSYLPKGRQATFRKLLQKAYEEPTYEGVKEVLKRVKKELSLINESAVRSLEEGLEETLTLHRFGLFEKLGKSLKTTNCIESVMALIGQRTDKVDYWKNSNQKQRWLATALLDIEARLNRIRGYKHLPELREALKQELLLEESTHKTNQVMVA